MGQESDGVTRRGLLLAGLGTAARLFATPASAKAKPMLPPIPVFDARTVGLVGLARVRVPQMVTLLNSCLGTLDLAERAGVVAADALARGWLKGTKTPYAAELEEIAALVPHAGVYLLNASYEWGCTTLAAPAPDHKSARLLRTLDWSFNGLGRSIEAIRQRGEAGEFLNLTWPGAVGVLSALAPGRFAATINQAPARNGAAEGMIATLLGQGTRFLSASAIPSMHLLREVFEKARDFDEARWMIETIPIASPTIFTLVGMTPDQTCVIERTETDHVTHVGMSSAANSWHYADFRDGWDGRDRDPASDSAERRRLIERLGRPAETPFAWVRPPVRNGLTRLAVELDPARSEVWVRGYERVGDSEDAAPVTADLHMIV